MSCCVVEPGDTKTAFTDRRVKSDVNESSPYAERCARSVSKMEHDERSGAPPEAVAKVICRVISKKKMPRRKTVGFGYKCITFFCKVAPLRLKLYVIEKIYG